MKAFLAVKRSSKILLAVIISISALGIFIPMRIFFADRFFTTKKSKSPYITVFIHGSFGPLLGFLSLPDVLNDKISGTLYRTTTKKMRMDDFFYKSQPILDRGLKRIMPTLNPALIGNKYYAAYPITQAYASINEACKPDNHNELLYTFGWSGLMSQHSRRYEAIRLYNALAQEVEKLQKEGLTPRIRIITHSHGGNLCLNLAAVQYVLKSHAFDQRQIISSDPDEQESIEKMAALFTKLTTKEIASMGVDQKIYDYVPQHKNLVIDELVMLGTPIQAETETFCYAPIFKTVYNLYSDEDQVQKSDWISTKKSLSNARVSKKAPASLLKFGPPARVIQAQIITHKGAIKAPTKNQKAHKASEEKSLLTQLLEGKNVFTRNSADPTHKELWFLGWENSDEAFSLPIAPLPIVAFIPLITKVLTQSTYTDATITLKKTDALFAITATSNKNLHSTTITLPLEIVTDLQKKTDLWKAPESTQLHEFEAVYKHLTT